MPETPELETAAAPKKPAITLAEPWTYRTALVTIAFPAGEHVVSPEIAAAAPQAPAPTQPEKETDDGNRIAAPRAPRRAGKVEG